MSRKIAVFLVSVISLIFSLSTYCFAASAVTINPSKTIAEAMISSHALVLYDTQTNYLSGWNHTGNFVNEFTGLQRPLEHYQVDGSASTENSYHSTTLVKKLGDWNHQHGNGIIAEIADHKILLSQVAGIELLLKIDSANSHLPTKKQIITTYGELVDSAQLNALDDENVYLSFALYGPVSTTMTFNGDYLLKLNTSNQLDQWLKVTIPTSQLTTYTEEHYQEQPISLAAAQNQVITGLRIMAETSSTQVVRNLILERFNDDTPKLFKEISLSLQYIGLVYSDSTKTK
jgi:hypothetical protein